MKKILLLVLTVSSICLTHAQVALPIDFEGSGIYSWTNFDGGNATVINNPQKVGINTSNRVGQMIKGPGGQPWGGSWIQSSAPISFSTLKYFRMKVFSAAPGIKVLLKVENESNPGQAFEVNTTTTLTNAWEDLSFNFSAINLAFSYHKIVIIFQLGTPGDGSANFTFLFDDIRQEAAPSGTLMPPKLPVTFDAAGIDKAFINFDGGATSVILNPHKTGINTTDTVARMVKNAGAVWAGSKLILGEAMDFTTKKLFRMKVYSPRVGARMLLKVEGSVPTFEKEATTTKANEWEELTFDYTGVNTTLSYNQLVFILDLGTAGDGSPNYTILFDDIRLEASGGGALSQMNVPVTFDDPSVNYGLIGFGGADASSIVTDPTNPSNKAARVIKSAAAETWAGTTVTAVGGGGFATKLPFAPGSTFMNVRVWSPDAGIKVRLKVEDSGDPTKSVETEATTTIANGWQNLVFDFSSQAAGTAAINYAFNYNKASIFFNFGVSGAAAGEKTYYFDDMVFGSTPLPVTLISFLAEKSGDQVLLTWSTASENKNKEFAVERSDRNGKWLEIAKIYGAGNSNIVRNYSAMDKMPLPGANFYRLRQTDFDGTTVYSAIRKVDLTGTTLEGCKVYPNPARSRILVVSNAFDGKVQYSITASNGATMQSGVINNPVSETGVDISRLPAGWYVLKLTDGVHSRMQKILVQ